VRAKESVSMGKTDASGRNEGWQERRAKRSLEGWRCRQSQTEGRGGARTGGRRMEGETEREMRAHVTWEEVAAAVQCSAVT
jgi:hypothetical protein